MKRLTMIPLAVLLLLPLVAMSWTGALASPIRSVFVPPGQAASVAPGPEYGPQAGRPGGPEPTGPEPADPVPVTDGPAPVVAAPAPIAAAPAPVVAAPVPSPGPAPGAQPTARKPDPVSTWTLAPALATAVTKAMADFPGRYSVAVQDLKTGERWVLNGSDRYHPASTIKMPVTLYALDLYRAGKLRWSDGIVYTPADFESPGGGAFETAPFGGVYPVENLVNRALMYSNNVAVNMLGRHLGWNNIRAWSRAIGGELYRLDDASPSVSVLSELGWWLHLDRVSKEDPKAAELVLRPLRDVAYGGRIRAGVPKEVPLLHKFGSYAGHYHDGGIVFGDRPFAMVILTAGAKEYEADKFIAAATAAIYEVMSEE